MTAGASLFFRWVPCTSITNSISWALQHCTHGIQAGSVMSAVKAWRPSLQLVWRWLDMCSSAINCALERIELVAAQLSCEGLSKAPNG